MEFKPLEEGAQLDAIKAANGVNVIFKHNTTCPISRSMRAQFEMDAPGIGEVDAAYFLDLLAHRDLSDAIAQQFGVAHESPQTLLIRDGKCINSQSLFNISAAELVTALD
jgi:bacillithiol system protein YtxJ